MTLTNPRPSDRRRMILLAPLIVAGNVFVLACVAGLCVGASRGPRGPESAPPGSDANQRIVSQYLAQHVPSHRYRIRQWFPATPWPGKTTAATGGASDQGQETGFAQRVKIVFYGPNGARQLDTIYWIRNGQVVRKTEADDGRFGQES